MVHSESFPYYQNPQNWNANQQAWGLGGIGGVPGGQGWNYSPGLGQAAFGQQGFGGWQGQGWGNPWQRQLSQQDIGEVVRHLIPFLPQIVGQAQQPQAAYGYGYGNTGFGGFGGQSGFGGYGQRHLSQQDVHEVVRQILPVIPQIVSLLQGQQQGPLGSAIFGSSGWGNQAQYGQGNLFGQQGPYGQNPYGLAAFGNVGGNVGGWGQQRQLNQAEVGEILRHLTAALPQVIASLQAFNQQQQQQRAA
jgi:hypothetical protein